ncbi:MAG: hypothetical protein IJZ26_00540 [Clostridia bacterium]|nr:hypothetical protein [Clostridia bacterium]
MLKKWFLKTSIVSICLLFSLTFFTGCTGNFFEVKNQTFVVSKVLTRVTVDTSLENESFWNEETNATNLAEAVSKAQEYFTEQYKNTQIIFTEKDVSITTPANKTFLFKQDGAEVSITNPDKSDTLDRFKFRNGVLRYLIYSNGMEVEFELSLKK